MTQLITREMLTTALPNRIGNNISDETLTEWNALIQDPEMIEAYQENFIGFTNILTEGKYKMTDYINAIMYVTHRLICDTNKEAYRKVFPQKYDDWVKSGIPSTYIDSYISSYNRSKLVTKMLEQAAIPFWILNQPTQQKMLNVLVDLAMNADSEKVRCDAANNALNHIKPPEVSKFQLDVDIKQDRTLDELRNAVSVLVSQQHEAISMKNVTAKDIAESKIIRAEDYE